MMQSCHFYVVLVIITDLFPLLAIAILFFHWGRLDAKCIQSSDKFLDVLK
jgi:hypothetical protein